MPMTHQRMLSVFAANHGPDTAMTLEEEIFRGSQVEIVDVQSEITVGAGMGRRGHEGVSIPRPCGRCHLRAPGLYASRLTGG